MINGEGTRGISSEVSSLDLLDEFVTWKLPKSDDVDASPVSSQYSSCGESEFERYCSANSVMGTPSLCGSVGTFNEFPDPEVGSLKSFKLGDSSDLDNFDTKHENKKILSSTEKVRFLTSEFSDGGSDAGMRYAVESGQGLMNIRNGLNCSVSHVEAQAPRGGDGGGLNLSSFSELNSALDEGLYGADDLGGILTRRESGALRFSSETDCTNDAADQVALEENKFSLGVVNSLHVSSGEQGDLQSHLSIEQVVDDIKSSTSKLGLGLGRKENGKCSDEDETSSRYEHSEGEDSMFGCDTDDEKRLNVYHSGNIQHPWKSSGKTESSLLMTSSIAFGAEDWDDFVQESGESTFASIVLNNMQQQEQQNVERDYQNPTTQIVSWPTSKDVLEQQRDVRDIPISSNHAQCGDESLERLKNCPTDAVAFLGFEVKETADVKNVVVTSRLAQNVNDPIEVVEISSFSKNIEAKDPLTEQMPIQMTYNEPSSENQCIINKVTGVTHGHQCASIKEVTSIHNGDSSECVELEKTDMPSNPFSDDTVNHQFSDPELAAETGSKKEEFFGGRKSCPLPLSVETNIKETMKDTTVLSISEDYYTPIKNFELNEFYNEVVHDMEEILLDSSESPAARFTNSSHCQSPKPLPSGDGASTASTSGTDNTNPLRQLLQRIDQVEIVGARQKKGDVSLSKRLVGVKQYTVYKIRVLSGEDQWEVERRYREFYALYHQLKTLFAHQGLSLPSPWMFVEQESKKLFGSTSPDGISERSLLIQECLQSVLHFRFLSTSSSALLLFLSHPKATPAVFSMGNKDLDSVSTLGKTISLIVDICPYKSTKQIVEAQHYICAGCHKHFDDEKTRMQEFVQTLGWGKPRLCEYSRQLFCSSCHTNETAVLPARVLHFWDFSHYPVSQIAKSYLDSIHDQPMLCVSAVNPFLFSKVPALQHVRSARRKICGMIPYILCPFRRSIYKGLGSRRYLLESNDFFALKDLVDLSKGVFAALPVMIDNVSRQILDHITEQCLICYDVGVPCNARQACADPSALIFPFQEEEIERCRSCELVFHKACVGKIVSCPCGSVLKLDKMMGETAKGNIGGSNDVGGTLDLLHGEVDSKSSIGLFSGLLSMMTPGKLQGTHDNDTIIPMGSLPGSSF